MGVADIYIHEALGVTHSVWRVKRTAFDRKRPMRKRLKIEEYLP